MGSRIMLGRAKHTLKEYLKLAGYVRWLRVWMAFVALTGLFVPTLIWINDIKAYSLSPETKRVIGNANGNLSAKFSFDEKGNKWQFNKNGIASLASSIAKHDKGQDVEGISSALSQLMAKQVGGAGKNDQSLYSVDLPAKAREGITYYDNVTRLSFKMIPTFSSRDGKLVDGRVVYPFSGGGQVVYTAKANGLKEDIVLSKYIGDTLSYGYELKLPDTLEARVLDDGSIGVYSANPALFGNISFSNDEDKARVMEGRKNGSKDNLVFGIPAPFIKDQKGQAGSTRYELRGKKLTVVATGLKGLQYPLTVDPSVTVTSSSDFENGNNEGEGNITFGSGEIRRGDVSGGTVGTWASADIGTAFTNARSGHSTVTYNGYIYVIGGSVSGGGTTDVRYAAICNGTNTNGGCTAGAGSAGKLGSWTSGGTLTEGRAYSSVAVYNGFIYVVGGNSGGANQSNNVQYSQIGANGAPGTWTNLGTFPTAIMYSDLIAYDGYLYVAGGCTNLASGNCSIFNGNVYSAAINATGTLGSWTQLSGTPLSTARYGHTTFAYNGYLYVTGGCSAKDVLNNCTTTSTSTEYAKINADGTLGAWSANTALATARRDLKSAIYNGYIYITGDSAIGSYISYAPLHASGLIGAWTTANTYATSKKDVAMTSYNGYLYITGGCTSNVSGCNAGSSYINVSEYVKIDAAGAVGPSVSTTAFDVEANGRNGHMSIAANGYLYVLGGRVEGGGIDTTVKLAPINADGTVGSWTTTNSFSTARQGAAVVVRGEYLYLIGGQNNTSSANCTRPGGVGVYYCNDIEWASINSSTGALTWQGSTFVYSSTQARAYLGAAVINDYLYVVGGIHNNNSDQSNEVDFAQFNADGSLGTFALTTQQMQTARANVIAVGHNGKLYAIASRTGAASEYATPATNGDITSAWTSTGSVPAAQADRWLTVTYNKGYVYATGGLSGGGAIANEIQIAKINSDGTMSSWSTSSNTLSPLRYLHSSVIYNDRLYILGGDSSLINSVAGVTYHQINNGGSGETTNWTTSGSTFTTARQDHSSVAHNGYLYVIGGCSASTCVSPHNDVRYAVINVDGTLGAWAAANTITARSQHTSVVHNGYLYVSGGNTGSVTNNTQYALICTGSNSGVAGCSGTPGSVGTWSNATNNFSNARGLHASAVYNGYVYIVGGNGGAEYNDVQYALLCTGTNTTGGCNGLQAGDIGTWTTDGGTSFTNVRLRHAAVAYGGYLYVMGGQNSGGVLNDVQFAPIASDGSIGTWAYTNPLPPQLVLGKAVARNGYLYMAAGYATSAFISSVYKVPIGSGGSLGAWEKTTSLNTARLQGALAEYNGTLYFSGGCTAGAFNLCTGFSNNVEHAAQLASARIGRYSKLISVNPTTDIADVHFNGSLGEGSSVVYRVAPSSGIFGATTAATQGTGSEPTPLCGTGTIYYVQLRVTLDDSTKAVFPDDSTSTVTDVMTYYRLNATPPPNLRLTGGKWFNGEVQQPLDICKQ